jgi:hypothetical protein
MAELQLHTTYAYDESTKQGNSQWTQMNEMGEIQYYSTHMLITKMRRETEYPILVFFEKVAADTVEHHCFDPSTDDGQGGQKNQTTGDTMTHAGGDSALSSHSTFGTGALASKTDVVNSLLGIHTMETGAMCFDNHGLMKDTGWLEQYESTQQKVEQEQEQQQLGQGGRLDGFVSRQEAREQCCGVQ